MKPATYPTIIEECLRINITKLKKCGYLDAGQVKSGSIKLESNRIDILVDMVLKVVTFRHIYLEKKIEYTVSLCDRPDNLGRGTIWYFRCPRTQLLCRNLYYYQGHFVHRKAITNGMYRIQTESKTFRKMGLLDLCIFSDENKRLTKYSKLLYRGKPTPKMKRIERLKRKILKY